MRELSLETLFGELLHAKVKTAAGPRIEPLLKRVGDDLSKAQECRIQGMEPDRPQPLAVWWAKYPDLGDFIDE